MIFLEISPRPFFVTIIMQPPLLSVALAGLQLRGVLLRYRSPAPDRDARLKQTPLISGISWIQSEGVSASFTDRHPAALSSLQARWRKIKAPEGRLWIWIIWIFQHIECKYVGRIHQRFNFFFFKWYRCRLSGHDLACSSCSLCFHTSKSSFSSFLRLCLSKQTVLRKVLKKVKGDREGVIPSHWSNEQLV